MRLHPILLAGILVGAGKSAPALAAAEGFTPAQWSAIRQGRLVTVLRSTRVSTLKDVLIAGRINAAPEAIWSVITDYANYPTLYPQIKESTISHVEGLVMQHRTVSALPWPLGSVWVNGRVEHSADHLFVHWNRLEGSLREFDGSWRLIPEGTATVLVYSSRIDPGIPLIPPWLIDWANAQVAPEVIGNVRRALKARGTGS